MADVLKMLLGFLNLDNNRGETVNSDTQKSAETTNWEAKAKELEASLQKAQGDLESRDGQIRGLSKYRSALEQLQKDAPGAFEVDPNTGQVNWKENGQQGNQQHQVL